MNVGDQRRCSHFEVSKGLKWKRSKGGHLLHDLLARQAPILHMLLAFMGRQRRVGGNADMYAMHLEIDSTGLSVIQTNLDLFMKRILGPLCRLPWLQQACTDLCVNFFAQEILPPLGGSPASEAVQST